MTKFKVAKSHEVQQDWLHYFLSYGYSLEWVNHILEVSSWIPVLRQQWNGNGVETDYARMLKIIKDCDFRGYLGIEYEGEKVSKDEGVRKTKALLEKVATDLA